jgi:maleylacetoacetate isomerase
VPGGHSARPVLYGYWRSSSSYRVRIALNLKGIDYRQEPVNLVNGDGEQTRPEYRAVNPLGLVPALLHAGRTLTQSVAICEYLEETFPEPPLLPADAAGRARVRGLVQTIACEIQPLNNLGVLRYLGGEMQQPESAVQRWYLHWIGRGFAAVEAWLQDAATGAFCHGDQPTLADCFLVPQVYNAERFGCDLAPYPGIVRIAGRCRALEAFLRASPERQPDAAPAP